MGEGWGLVSFEHAATGAAQVAPRSGACAELWAGRAELVETDEAGVPPWGLLTMRTVTADGVAAALHRLYADPAHRRRSSMAAYQQAPRPEYDWGTIVEQWCALLDQVLHRSASTGLAGRTGQA